jgi:transcriptional regulator with XRE-family HTH domain
LVGASHLLEGLHQIGTFPAIIGRYERNEITPSVEVAAKIADALEVSLDYLVSTSSFVVKDKKCSIVWSCWKNR